MSGILPPPIAKRQGVTTFDAVVRRNFSKNRPCIEAVLEGKNWLSGSFINKESVKKLFQYLDMDANASVDSHRLGFVLDVVQFELWLGFLCKQPCWSPLGELPHEVQRSCPVPSR
jgi:hypothetical protein